MGVRTHIFLPSDVRCLDVAKAVALLAGPSPSATDYGFAVRGLEIASLGDMPGPTVRIFLTGLMVDGEAEHQFYLSCESSELPGHDRQISIASNAFWVAMGRKLIRFFGGALVYADCESREPGEYKIRTWPYSREVDDSGCLELSSRIFKLKPLTDRELKPAADYAYCDRNDE